MNKTNGWIFGWRGDLIAFTGPLVLSVILHQLFKMSLLGEGDWPSMYAMQFIFNVPHVYSTFTYTYTSPDILARHKKWLFGIPVILLVMNIALAFYSTAFLRVFYSIWSCWHFIKQQQAWFYISAGMGVKRDKWTSKIDKAAIIAVTLGSILTSQCMPESRGWMGVSDLPELPEFLYEPFLFTTLFLVFLYASWHGHRGIIKGIPQNWAAHHIFLAAFTLWGLSRLGNFYPWAGYAHMIAHAVPYFYLGFRYIKPRMSKGEQYKFPAIPYVWICVGIYLVTVLVGYAELFGRYGNWTKDPLPYTAVWVLFNTLNFTHYTFDMFMWNRQHNHDWVEALGEPQSEIVPVPVKAGAA